MIKIERGRPPAENAMDQKKEGELQKIRELAASGKLKSNNFKTLWSELEVKDFLYQSQHGKCCYCERRRGKKEIHVDHFRPKTKVKVDKKNPPWLLVARL